MKADTIIMVVCTVVGAVMIRSGLKGLERDAPLMKAMADKEAERIKNMK